MEKWLDSLNKWYRLNGIRVLITLLSVIVFALFQDNIYTGLIKSYFEPNLTVESSYWNDILVAVLLPISWLLIKKSKSKEGRLKAELLILIILTISYIVFLRKNEQYTFAALKSLNWVNYIDVLAVLSAFSYIKLLIPKGKNKIKKPKETLHIKIVSHENEVLDSEIKIDIREDIIKPTLINDDPYNQEDLLDNQYIVNSIVNQIVENSNTNRTLNIGIEGPWGSGKTHILYRVEKELKKKSKIIFINFSPWKENTFLSIENALLETLRAELSKYSLEAGSNLTNLIAKFSKESFKPISTILNFLGFKDYTTVQDSITNLGEILVVLEKRIVVCIDDVDRLEPNEIKEVLKLIRSIVDFPNFYFIICYDRSKLDDETMDAKFIQTEYQINLPTSFAQIRKFLLEKAIEITEKFEYYGQNPPNQKGDYKFLINEFLVHPISYPNFRDCIRIINQFSSKIQEMCQNHNKNFCPGIVFILVYLENSNEFKNIYDLIKIKQSIMILSETDKLKFIIDLTSKNSYEPISSVKNEETISKYLLKTSELNYRVSCCDTLYTAKIMNTSPYLTLFESFFIYSNPMRLSLFFTQECKYLFNGIQLYNYFLVFCYMIERHKYSVISKFILVHYFVKIIVKHTNEELLNSVFNVLYSNLRNHINTFDLLTIELLFELKRKNRFWADDPNFMTCNFYNQEQLSILILLRKHQFIDDSEGSIGYTIPMDHNGNTNSESPLYSKIEMGYFYGAMKIINNYNVENFNFTYLINKFFEIINLVNSNPINTSLSYYGINETVPIVHIYEYEKKILENNEIEAPYQVIELIKSEFPESNVDINLLLDV